MFAVADPLAFHAFAASIPEEDEEADAGVLAPLDTNQQPGESDPFTQAKPTRGRSRAAAVAPPDSVMDKPARGRRGRNLRAGEFIYSANGSPLLAPQDLPTTTGGLPLQTPGLAGECLAGGGALTCLQAGVWYGAITVV